MLPLFLSVIVFLCGVAQDCDSARILCVFPTPSISHQVVFRKLTVELSKRGHELVIFTPDPANDRNLTNYTEIDLHSTYNLLPNFILAHGQQFQMWKDWAVISAMILDEYFSHREMQRIIAPDSGEKFDLIIFELFDYNVLYGLTVRFNAPMVGITAFPLSPISNYVLGNPVAYAYTPGPLDTDTDDPGFWRRLNTVISAARFLLIGYFNTVPLQENLLKKYFGPNMPYSGDISKEISVVLVNNHVAVSYPRPNLPGIVDIGGIAVNKQLKGLDPELKKFVDGAVHGFIYLSLGSNVKSSKLPGQQLKAFLSAFAELPYRVVWKWELETLSEKPKNVLIRKWLPQFDVLAHPNIKLFIYQGGLQSTEEAVVNAVPLLGIPVFFDQEFNVRKLVSSGVCKRLDFLDLSKDLITNAIIEIISNESYKRNMLKLRDLFEDQPETPLERAVWWTEYVLRHNGTPHLRTNVRHMTWYERELIDVFGFLVIVALTICFVLYELSYFAIKNLLKCTQDREKVKLKSN